MLTKLLELQNLNIKYWKRLKPEAREQAQLVLWLEENNYTYTAIPNSTYTKSILQKVINKITGLNPGLCDLLIILKRGSLLFLELKREKKSLSKVSESQKKWIDELNKINNTQAIVCYGYIQAIEEIKRIESL